MKDFKSGLYISEPNLVLSSVERFLRDNEVNVTNIIILPNLKVVGI